VDKKAKRGKKKQPKKEPEKVENVKEKKETSTSTSTSTSISTSTSTSTSPQKTEFTVGSGIVVVGEQSGIVHSEAEGEFIEFQSKKNEIEF